MDHSCQHPPSPQLLPFHCQFQSLSLAGYQRHFLPQESSRESQGSEQGWRAPGAASPWGLPPLHGGTSRFPCPRTLKQPIRALNMTEELSFLQPSQLGCWLGFLKQSLASSLAAPELVCLVLLVQRTALTPVSSRSAGRGLGALRAGGQHHALELGACGSQGFSPHPTH